MKYKVGDKVRVHSKEWFRTNCSKNCIGAFEHEDGNNTLVHEMTKFCGQEVTIYHIDTDNYIILEDDGLWYWQDWMFEDMNNNTNIIFNPNIVEDFAKLIGVELDEEFYDENYIYRYKITNKGLEVYDTVSGSCKIYTGYGLNTFFKMIKEDRFMKKWAPKDGDKVYFPAFMCGGLWDSKIYNSKNEHDNEMLKNGLCFKTIEEAMECAKKIIKNMKEG